MQKTNTFGTKKVSNSINTIVNNPIDAVITWVNGNDPAFAAKLDKHLQGVNRERVPGAIPSRFTSLNEIRYCVLSILTFAPFIRRIYIVTDGQNPNLDDDLTRYFPHRKGDVIIVDHTHIFRGYEEYLPVFNSRSIETMLWRIEGLANSFVYFNDDMFLVRPVSPEDWFTNGKPMLLGHWAMAPAVRVLANHLKVLIFRHIAGLKDYQPKPSYNIGQWHAARKLGFRFRYLSHSHIPNPANCDLIIEYFKNNENILCENISFRFRAREQFTLIPLSNHLQLLSGNRREAKPASVYVQPHKRSAQYIDRKIKQCQNNSNVKYVCFQNLELCDPPEHAQRVFRWMDKVLGLENK